MIAELPIERPSYALGLRLLAVSGFSVMSIFIKLASERGVTLPEIVFWRQALAMPVVLFALWQGPGWLSVRTNRPHAHLCRSLVGLACIAMSFASITLLPLAVATTLSFAAPIFATLLGFLFFGEKVGRIRGLAVFFGFLGVLIVARPTGAQFNVVGVGLGLGAAFLAALVSFQIRDLGRTETATTIVFWFTALSTLALFVIVPFVWQPHDINTWLMLIAMGSFGGIAQFAMVSSVRYAPVSTVVGMDYFSLIWTTIAGWLLWQQLPSLSMWIGAGIICASGVFIAVRERGMARERLLEHAT
jgi:drug/metabolite transporter (DMT)-like permease